MKTDKLILDACCGGKMFYYDKNDERVLFQDIRNVSTHLCDGRYFEVKPDVQADFTNMPYEDESFQMVVFDPPHLFRNVGKSKFAEIYGSLNAKAKPTGYQQIKYGSLYSDWRDMLSKGFSECFRVLKKGGFLIFKWNETDIRVSEILKLTPEKPIFGHISGKRSNTHWICFMKGGSNETINTSHPTKNTKSKRVGIWDRGFERGAQWMIDKAVEWFRHQKEEIGISWFDDYEIRFRKAMEE